MMNLEMIRNTRLCSNAKPPIDHAIKYKEEAEIKDQIAEFLASGREIEQLASTIAENKTFKERNDSYFGLMTK
tara:strand:+ start:362 stop:580 length:219 start_codon:yes stop_codon:yes gene_type:complete